MAICTFNGARFIDEQISSILAQTRVPDQIVLADDGSTDGTVNLVVRRIEEWNTHCVEPIAFSLLPVDGRRGVTANFERAVTAATGDLIALCDQDDVWRSDRLERALEIFAKQPSLQLLHTDARLIDSAGRVLGSTLFESLAVSPWEKSAISSGNGFDVLIRRNVVTGATTVFRRSLLEPALPFPKEWVHDEWLAMVAAVTGVLRFSEYQSLDYRQHESNAIGVSRLSVRGKVARLRESRGERNRRLAGRADVLLERASGWEVLPVGALAHVERKAAHERFRSALPASRLGRVRPVLRAYVAGDYRRYGRGGPDAVRDLLQPV